MAHFFLEQLKRLKALADTGTLYANNEFDKERYAELNAISLDLLGKISGLPVEELEISLPVSKDYPTPKVDIRGLVLSADKKILLVKESADGKWSLPGGWADIGCTPKEVIRKECREETGLEVEVNALLAVYDKRVHPHPPQPFYVYKMIFWCEALQQELAPGFDIEHCDWFAIDALPPLSTDRILESQIRAVYRKVLEGDLVCDVD